MEQNKARQQHSTPEWFTHIPTGNRYLCIGRLEGMVWYGEEEHQYFDPSDCDFSRIHSEAPIQTIRQFHEAIAALFPKDHYVQARIETSAQDKSVTFSAYASGCAYSESKISCEEALEILKNKIAGTQIDFAVPQPEEHPEEHPDSTKEKDKQPELEFPEHHGEEIVFLPQGIQEQYDASEEEQVS